MSVAVMLQALGWASVLWMVVVHVLIQHGRLPDHGTAYRIAGCAAAASVVAASAAEEIWPVAVLGLLWLRIEVFGRRHQAKRLAPTIEPGTHPADPASGHPSAHPAGAAAERMPEMLVGAMTRQQQRPAHHPDAGHPHHLPHLPHVPHPHLGRKTVDVVFRIEMGIVIVVALVLFGIWAEQQRTTFRTNTDSVVCNWIEGC